jgi:hypothetical protein
MHEAVIAGRQAVIDTIRVKLSLHAQSHTVCMRLHRLLGHIRMSHGPDDVVIRA